MSIASGSNARGEAGDVRARPLDPEGVGVADRGTARARSAAAPRLIPPPWSSSLPRSSEMTMRGRSRRARCASIWSASQWTLTIAVSTPFSARRSRQWSISARPRTFTSGFGSVSVIGRMRWPRPAAKTMAVLGIGALIVDSFPTPRLSLGPPRRLRFGAERARQVGLIPERQGRKQRMREVAAPDSARCAAGGAGIAACRRACRAARRCRGFSSRAARPWRRRTPRSARRRSPGLAAARRRT